MARRTPRIRGLALEPPDLRQATDRRTLRIREDNGQKSREVPVRPELQAALTAATCYGATGGGPLVDVSRTTAWRWVQLAAKRAIDAGQLDRGRHVGTHTLRHSYARHLLLNGIPLNYLSRWLGHPSIQTTLIYFVKGGGKLDRADTTTSQRWQTLDQSVPTTDHQPSPSNLPTTPSSITRCPGASQTRHLPGRPFRPASSCRPRPNNPRPDPGQQEL